MKQGKAITASLQHLVFHPAKPSSKYSTVIALHGLGADDNDLAPLVQRLGFEDILLITPRAPLPSNFGMGYAWYDMQEIGVPEPQTFRASFDLLQRFIVEIKNGYPIDPRRIILLGFSQGAVMAYAAGLLQPTSIRGIVALSGYIPVRSGLPLKLHELNGLLSFISHGMYDELIPVHHGREAAELLKAGGADVVYREYSMGHEVCEETLRDLAAWMGRSLA